MSTIDLRKLTKKFGDFTAVRDADLSVKAGEVVCLLGPSGCGKTTTLRMIAGLDRATSGDVIIAGARMNELPPPKRNIAMVFQFYALYPALTVGENLGFPLHVEGLPAAERARRVAQVAETLQLGHILDRLPGQIAEGEKQRVAVARAIIRDPSCFLFDEPLSRLDVELRQTMRGQIKEVLQGLSKATVIVTHDQLEALTMANRTAIMRDGRIEQIGTPHEVFARPANAFVASFIGTPQMNLIGGELIRAEGETADIRMEGTTVRLPVDPAVRGMKPGRVTIGMRPRAVALAAEAGPQAFTALAELIEPMGAETLIHARTVNGDDIRVVLPRARRVAVGETLHLVPEAGQTHVFDEAGRAVRA
jgi:multiple sugar transport system ATP-binding protein